MARSSKKTINNEIVLVSLTRCKTQENISMNTVMLATLHQTPIILLGVEVVPDWVKVSWDVISLQELEYDPQSPFRDRQLVLLIFGSWQVGQRDFEAWISFL